MIKLSDINWGKVCIFASGVLFGTAGLKVLSSDDAKKCYTETTAAALRAQDCVLKVSTCVRENCSDIYEDAKKINEKRAAEKAAAVVEAEEA